MGAPKMAVPSVSMQPGTSSFIQYVSPDGSLHQASLSPTDVHGKVTLQGVAAHWSTDNPSWIDFCVGQTPAWNQTLSYLADDGTPWNAIVSCTYFDDTKYIHAQICKWKQNPTAADLATRAANLFQPMKFKSWDGSVWTAEGESVYNFPASPNFKLTKI